jgi:phosphate starvation-inducible PhoH-like protein
MSKKQRSENRVPETLKIREFTYKTKKQELLAKSIREKEVTIAAGVAGSGKTIVSLATAIQLLGEVYKKVILIKSVVNPPGEEIGFIPGTVSQKMDPYIMSYT